ncbi:hypothetical protein VZQ01_27775 [Myxococcus faecalis]|uniref:hypothetical protein n=1 Tax=Myxococcus faecalis TaxID=3115646 RepID=UPI0038D1F311
MGIQFEFVLDEHDEARLCAFMKERWDALCTGRFVESAALNAVSIGECADVEQIVFPRELLGLVGSRVVPLAARQGKFHVSPKGGACLEWTRSTKEESGIIPGRFYLDTQSEGGDLKTLRTMMRGIKEFVKKGSPLVGGGRHSVFVGESLAARVRSGEAQVVYPNGSLIPLEMAKK